MSDTTVEARWVAGQQFEAAGSAGVPVLVDGASAEGLSPMESVLAGLAACMGIDVVEILSKSRVSFDGMTVRVEGDRRAEPPRRYTAVRMTYEMTGVAEEAETKLQRAVDLSRDKYCSVLHSLRPDLDISVRIESD